MTLADINVLESNVCEEAIDLVFADQTGPLGQTWWTQIAAKSDSRLPQDHVGLNLDQLYMRIASLLCLSQPSAVRRSLRDLDAATANHPDRRSWRQRIQYLAAVLAEREADMTGVLEHCEAIRGPAESFQDLDLIEPEGPIQQMPWFAAIDMAAPRQLPNLAARASVWLGRPQAAAMTLAGGSALDPGHLAAQAILASREGHLARAGRLANDALEAAAAVGMPDSFATLDANLAWSEVLFERNDLDGPRSESSAPWSGVTGPEPRHGH